MIAGGRDPSRERQMAKLAARFAEDNTFSAVAREFIQKRVRDGITEETKSKTEWLLSLLEPGLGKIPVGEITAPLLLAVLQEVEFSGRRETARRLRSFAGRVLNYAIVTGRRTDANPAPALHRALSSPVTRSHPAIVDENELGALLRAIDEYAGYPSTIGALRVSPHLFQRPGEIRTMTWDELDLDGGRWTIPAVKMKMRRPHEVPLSRQVTQIICSMAEVARGSEFVFPAYHNPKIPISENAINQALRRMGYGGTMTAHGFRSTASSLLNESNMWNPDAIERALAHQDGNAIRAVYNRSAYWRDRVEMMQWWSDHLDALKAAS
jgi:integrase